MKAIQSILILIFTANFIFAQNNGEILKFKSKIGFLKSEDSIVDYQFLENNKKVLLIGQRNFQFWDVENAQLLKTVPHQIPQFAPQGFVNNYIFLGLPSALNFKPYYIEPTGKWIITIEIQSNRKSKSAIVRDLQTMKQIAVLDFPTLSTEFITLDVEKNEILTYGQTDKKVGLAAWDKETFQLKRMVSIDDYKWHQFIKNDGKVVVGSGSTKILWGDSINKQGNRLTLRDVKTGAIEKEYTAQNLTPETPYQETTVSRDEKFLMSKRDNRIFVWEIDGDGSPKFEISPANTKEEIKMVKVLNAQFMIVSINKKLSVYDLNGNGSPQFEIVSERPDKSVELAAQTADGRYFAARNYNKLFVLETTGNGKPAFTISPQSETERFTTIEFMDGDRYLGVGRVNRSEKIPEKTEFYNVETGKLASEISMGIEPNAPKIEDIDFYNFEKGKLNFFIPPGIENMSIFTRDKKFFYSTGIGGTTVWNFAERKAFDIPLEFADPSDSSSVDHNLPYHLQIPYNIEHTTLSPTGRLILKYGNHRVSIYDIETGKESQTIFDPENVKYDKQNKIKKSGFTAADWTDDGKYLFAFDEKGLWSKFNTISFWQVLK